MERSRQGAREPGSAPARRLVTPPGGPGSHGVRGQRHPVSLVASAQRGPRLRYQLAVRLVRLLTAVVVAASLWATPAAGAVPRRVPVGFYGVMYDGDLSSAPIALQ